MRTGKIRPMDEISDEALDRYPASSVPAKSGDKKRSSRGGARKVTSKPTGMPPPPPDYTGGTEPPSPYTVPYTVQRPPSNFPKYGAIILIIAALTIILPAYETLTTTQDEYMDPLTNDSDIITVSGTVYNDNYNGIANATVGISGFDTVRTDEDGKFFLSNVRPGKRVIDVKKEGYISIEHEIYLEGELMGLAGDDSVELEFVLTPGNGTDTTGNFASDTYKTIGPILKICGIGFIIAIIFMVVGAIFALKRRRFAFVIIACVAGIFFGLNAWLIGTALSIIAIILFYKSKREFS